LPLLHDVLPYRYAKASAATLQYWRVPTVTEERAASLQLSASPELTTLAARVPNATAALALPDYLRMAMEPGFYVSVDREEQVASDASPWPQALVTPAQGAELPPTTTSLGAPRTFVRTVRGGYVPSESLTPVVPPAGLGVVLGDGVELPLGIVHRRAAKAWRPDPLGAAPHSVDDLPHAAIVPLAAEGASSATHEGRVVTRSGLLVARAALRVATKVVRPALVPRRARLIHVRLSEQTLVAYEGDRPVFATLVSSGKLGFETPTGVFRIYAKHVSTTMDGTAPRSPAATPAPATTTATVVPEQDEAYSIEDVAWTMYFSGNYALHAAFWHDRFGAVRSHGCVNLPPADARWLFRWATPVLPAEWHGVQATRDNPGTWVFIE
jgi:lipoprotein-anchoring transpeptidase ErfK/SrfK